MKMSWLVLILTSLIGVCAGLAAEAGSVVLRNTYYYVVLEREHAQEPADAQILDMKGEVLARVSPKFKHAVDIEGTGRLLDGRVINFAGRVNGETRYLIAHSRYGYGVGTCALVPFRTVAVDPNVIALGSRVYIAETDGMRLPGGRRHNGIWLAEDIGSAIVHDRVDLFVGDGDQGRILTAAGIENLSPLHVSVVSEPGSDSCVHQQW